MGPAADPIVAGLDQQQWAAAALGPGPAQILAPAGSGKTATLVARIGVLLGRGVPADQILVVTFNREAAAELGNRIRLQLGRDPAEGGPEVRTLHALARQVLLDAGVPVRLVADRLPLLRRARRVVMARHGPQAEPLPAAEELDALVSAHVVEGRPVPDQIRSVVTAYEGLLATRGAVDFDGLLVGALHVLRGDVEIRRRWQARFSHVLVDEFQDVDAAQLDLVSVLAEPERNLFVVGDDDQTIYAWRLADVRRILDFPIRYPDARRIVLETNYRCPAPVVAAADRLIATNRERVPKRLRAAPGREPDRAILTWPLRGPDALDELATACGRMASPQARLAILARTRAELVPMGLALLRTGIRHAARLPAPLDAEPVQALLDDLRATDAGRPPFPALVVARAARGWRRADPDERLGADDHAALDAAIGWAVGHARIDTYLAACAEARARLAALRVEGAPIELATVHGAKGREWPTVVVLGLETDRFPNRRSLIDAVDPARALEDERRLAYVAVTRCRSRLILAYDPDRPSPFVAELRGVRRRAVGYRPTSGATASR